MNTGSLKLGSFLGISVKMHWSVGLIAMLLGASLAQTLGWAAGAVGVVAFLASILAHEFAHALTARRFAVGTESIQLWALGGVARLDREAPTAKAEGWIAAAGPLASVAIAVASIGGWIVLGGSTGDNQFVATLGWLGVINAILAIFNLLPGAPLDGGRILKAVRWAIHGDRHRAAVEAGRAGMVLGWALAGLGSGSDPPSPERGLVDDHRCLHRRQRQGRDLGRPDRGTPRGRQGARPHLVRGGRRRHRHGRRLDALAASPPRRRRCVSP